MLRSIFKQPVLVLLTMTAGLLVFLLFLALSKWAFGSHWFGVAAAVGLCLIADMSARVRRDREEALPQMKEII